MLSILQNSKSVFPCIKKYWKEIYNDICTCNTHTTSFIKKWDTVVENFFLLDENGFFTKTCKSILSSELEKVLTATDGCTVNLLDLSTCYTADFMACARKISQKELKTFSDFCKDVCLYVKKLRANTVTRINFIILDIMPFHLVVVVCTKKML